MRNKPHFILLITAAMATLLFIGCSSDDPVSPPTTGTITISVEPDGVTASWTLSITGADDVLGTGDQTLTNKAPGEYTLTWDDVDGYVTPTSAPQTLAAGATVAFTGTYVEEEDAGTIVIDLTPDALAGATWALTGPQNETGSDDDILANMPVGDYTLTWGAVAGYIAPPSDTQTLTADGTIVFESTYLETMTGFVLTPPVATPMPATFTMGSNVEPDETPHQVTLTGRFYVAETEVTNAQYVAAVQWAYDQGHVTATTNTVRDALDGSTAVLLAMSDPDCQISFSGGVFSAVNPDHPVVEVTWFGAAAYCDWLSLQEGLPKAYNHGTWSCNDGAPYEATGYRLPTEAEWEFACRAATTTAFSTGDCLDAATEANYHGSFPYDGCASGPYLEFTSDAGSYAANPWGLYDMHGNVYEWCNDWSGAYAGDETDPEGVGFASRRVLRGGDWFDRASSCRSANRDLGFPDTSYDTGGFRPVISTP